MSGVIPFQTRDSQPSRAKENPAYLLAALSPAEKELDQERARYRVPRGSESLQAPSRVGQMDPRGAQNGHWLSEQLSKLEKRAYNHRPDYGQGTTGFPRLKTTWESTRKYELFNPKPVSWQNPRAVKFEDPSTHPPSYYPLSDHELASLFLAGFDRDWMRLHHMVDVTSYGTIRKRRKPAGWPYVMTNESGQLVFGLLAGGYLLCGDYASFHGINKAFEALIKNFGNDSLSVDTNEPLTPSQVLVPDGRQIPRAVTEVQANSDPYFGPSKVSSSTQAAKAVPLRPEGAGRFEIYNVPLSVSKSKSPLVACGSTESTAKGLEPSKLPSESRLALQNVFWGPEFPAKQRALENAKHEFCRTKELADLGKSVGELHEANHQGRRGLAVLARLISMLDETMQEMPSMQHAPSLKPIRKVIDWIDGKLDCKDFEGPEPLIRAMEEMQNENFDAQREVEELLGCKFPPRAGENIPENPIVGSAETARLVDKHTEGSNTNDQSTVIDGSGPRPRKIRRKTRD